ncbi:MAG: hypothetical protein JWN84_294 [Nocardioides sp.]|jgi:hypothetical protein|nr:hypothetical protein [Nocardioides sp.]
MNSRYALTPTSYQPSSGARWVFRAIGLVLVVGGVTAAIAGGRALAGLGDFESPGFDELGPLVIGTFATIFGLGFLNAGFLGAQARYAATETAPALRTAGTAWRGDDAVFCSRCGAGSRAGARFCDACGHGLG